MFGRMFNCGPPIVCLTSTRMLQGSADFKISRRCWKSAHDRSRCIATLDAPLVVAEQSLQAGHRAQVPDRYLSILPTRTEPLASIPSPSPGHALAGVHTCR